MLSRRSALVLPVLALACGRSERSDLAADSALAVNAINMTVADSGMLTPESVVHDVTADVYLVSNINGAPLAKDDNGFISRITPDGKLAAARWIAGGTGDVTLHAPKGMAVKGDTLFVTDIDVIRAFDRTSGAPLESWEVPGAMMLNDLAIGPDGALYVTDSGLKAGPGGLVPSGTDAVYRFAQGKAVAVVKDTTLGRPNGLSVDASGITVVTFGTGEVYRLDPATGARASLPKPPKGQLDGIEALADGSWLISSWEGSAVYRLSNGAYTVVVDSVASPADIGYDRTRGLVLIPIFSGNKIEIRSVK